MSNAQGPAEHGRGNRCAQLDAEAGALSRPSLPRSLTELGITFAPLAGLWALMWASYYFGFWWLTLLLAVPAAGFLVRLFMIQHDCGHGSFFRHASPTTGSAARSAC